MRRAYTLVQLLITITMIAAVVGWLTPHVARVHDRNDTGPSPVVVLAFRLWFLSWPFIIVLARLPGSAASAEPPDAATTARPNSPQAIWRGFQWQARNLGAVWWVILVVAAVGVVTMP